MLKQILQMHCDSYQTVLFFFKRSKNQRRLKGRNTHTAEQGVAACRLWFKFVETNQSKPIGSER
jgi:hypothetical protein